MQRFYDHPIVQLIDIPFIFQQPGNAGSGPVIFFTVPTVFF